MGTNEGSSIGLALSGGGFRATLFGLGSLWRLNEARLLGRLARVTSVSGGSILAGVLAHGWRRLDFIEGHAVNFDTVVAQPVRDFCSQSIDIKTAALGHLVPFMTSGEFLARRYAKDLFGDTLLRELPDAASARRRASSSTPPTCRPGAASACVRTTSPTTTSACR